MSRYWVFHEDKVDEAIAKSLDENEGVQYSGVLRDVRERAIRDFLNSKALADLGMRKE